MSYIGHENINKRIHSSQGNFYSSFKIIRLFIILLVTELIIMNILAMGQVVTIILCQILVKGSIQK